jgi:hypothetical protein
MEAHVLARITGVKEILSAPDGKADALEAMYPDAAFAIRIANDLFNHNRALSLITQNAYFAILRGEAIADVRCRYDKELNEYWNQHLWDD